MVYPPTIKKVINHIPATEVPELTAAATVGIQYAATPSQRSNMSSNLVPGPSGKCNPGDKCLSKYNNTTLRHNVGCISRVNLEKGGRVGVRRRTVQT